jgi:hypothetical protein
MIGLLEFCFKLFFTSNPLLNSCQIWISPYLEGVEGSFQISAS